MDRRGFIGALALLIASGCAPRADWIQGTLVTADVTGVWRGRAYALGGGGGVGDMEMSLEQRGPKVTGEYRYRGEKHFIEGTVSGDTFTFRDADGDIRGQATVDGDEMSGQGFSKRFQQGEFKLTLQRQPGGRPESR